VPRSHPLLDQHVRDAIEDAASDHLAERWTCTSFTNLNDQTSHPAGVLHGPGVSVFAKLGVGADAAEQFASELRGLGFVREAAAVVTPTPIGSGLVELQKGAVPPVVRSVARAPADRAAFRSALP
jgi:hypothetical protein